MLYDIQPNVCNETDLLKTVVVGLPQSLGAQPTLEETYDARSYRSVEEGNYPLEKDIIEEMNGLVAALERHGVEVLRPQLLPDYNQIFARDVAFVIDDRLFIANMISDRQKEIDAFGKVLEHIDPANMVHLPENVLVEGGDVVLYNDILFMGVTEKAGINQYKMARTNEAALAYFLTQFPQKQIIPLRLKKHDTRPEEGILHLDCAFQPVGKGKAIYYPEAFVNKDEVALIEKIFGKENLFAITPEEAFDLTTNILSISPNKILIEERFCRLAKHLDEVWKMEVVSIPYYEVSKQGGLLRCSTCPLVRHAS